MGAAGMDVGWETERQIQLDGYTPEYLPKGHPARLAKVVAGHVLPVVDSVLDRIRALTGVASLEEAIAQLTKQLQERDQQIARLVAEVNDARLAITSRRDSARAVISLLIEIRGVTDSVCRGMWFGKESASTVLWKLVDQALEITKDRLVTP